MERSETSVSHPEHIATPRLQPRSLCPRVVGGLGEEHPRAAWRGTPPPCMHTLREESVQPRGGAALSAPRATLAVDGQPVVRAGGWGEELRPQTHDRQIPTAPDSFPDAGAGAPFAPVPRVHTMRWAWAPCCMGLATGARVQPNEFVRTRAAAAPRGKTRTTSSRWPVSPSYTASTCTASVNSRSKRGGERNGSRPRTCIRTPTGATTLRAASTRAPVAFAGEGS
mmetsp:Transcript_44707/g.148220  ORF Transcript_44707/g.148220 Transcript_44707/m.148220 type:complete len:225 (-) Transcript_44707:1797-2471(-)